MYVITTRGPMDPTGFHGVPRGPEGSQGVPTHSVGGEACELPRVSGPLDIFLGKVIMYVISTRVSMDPMGFHGVARGSDTFHWSGCL